MMNRRDFLVQMGAASAAIALKGSGWASGGEAKKVRIGFIGVGGRGTGLLHILIGMEGVSVPAICDINEAHLDRGIEIVRRAGGGEAAGYSKGPYDYRRMLERDDLDGILVATPAKLHAEMAVDSMLAGKHVATEVPGATKLEECWELVKVKEKSGKRYMLLENYSYTRERMMVGAMARAGVFGQLTSAECAYIHNCSALRFEGDGQLTWRGAWKRDNFGCLYPTHAVGPVSKWMDIHRGDRIVSVVSLMNEPAALHDYVVRRFGADSEQAKTKFKAGEHSVTMLKTAKGKLITIFYDTDSPRPMSIFYVLQGTAGAYDSREGIYIEGVNQAEQWEQAGKYLKKYDHADWKKHGRQAAESGHGGGDWFVIADFVNMVRQDREPWIDVYDSAAWSSIVELSAESVSKGGAPVAMPDFTGGKWKQGGAGS